MTRHLRHECVSGHLSLRSDRELAALVSDARGHGTGIGGQTARVEVAGEPVFVKQIPLTARELAEPHSTANLFGLPMWYQYGVGSAGFGAWRELAAHRITTGWVLAFMNGNGLWHFDGHFSNVLTDGRQPVFADFGLALHNGFALTGPERAWLAGHADHDVRHTSGHMATWIAGHFRGTADRAAVIDGDVPLRGPPGAEAVMRRHAGRARSMHAFFDALVHDSKRTPYPSPFSAAAP